MMMAMPDSTATCWANAAVATVPKVMAMISADKIKSVRIAPLILSFSNSTKSTLASTSAFKSFSSCAWVSALLCKNLCASFSNPSKHKNAPPTINKGVTNHGAK